MQLIALVTKAVLEHCINHNWIVCWCSIVTVTNKNEIGLDSLGRLLRCSGFLRYESKTFHFSWKNFTNLLRLSFTRHFSFFWKSFLDALDYGYSCFLHKFKLQGPKFAPRPTRTSRVSSVRWVTWSVKFERRRSQVSKLADYNNFVFLHFQHFLTFRLARNTTKPNQNTHRHVQKRPWTKISDMPWKSATPN